MTLRSPWATTYAAVLREGLSQVEARARAGVSARQVAEACAADRELERELDAARDEGQRGRQARGPSGTAVGWREAAAASAAREAEGRARDSDEPDLGEGWAKARREAAAIAPGHYGTLLWIDARCQKAKMHALDPWWAEHFRLFYASGKMEDAGRGGLRAGKSDSIPRALVNDALFSLRELDPATVGVIPIMSRDRTEATDRFTTIRQILKAIGVDAKDKKDDLEAIALPGGIGGVYESSTLPSGGGVIRLRDSQNHKIEFRIYPARVSGAIGFTGVGGFCDEVDLWPWEDEIDQATGKKQLSNPAGKVIKLLEKRFTTQPEARLYVWSASYATDSAHRDLIDPRPKGGGGERDLVGGDTMIRYIARLGEAGARRDEVERRRLADYLAERGVRMFGEGGEPSHARLLASADPLSKDIPAWVTNPIKADILRCYGLSDENLTELLGLYGGRAAEHGAAAMSDEDFEIVGDYGRYHEETPAERDYG
jgi:hypothetical protein